MSNKSFTEEFKDNVKSTYAGFLKFLDDHDSAAWPAFWVFFAVVTVGMFFNVEAFAPIVGYTAAISLGVFFEYAIIAWKSTTSRKRNDAKQNQLAYAALWLSVILAISMLVVNLFRIGGEAGFEYIAYAIVGIAAGVQVVFYLLFDGANPDKTMDREHAQNEREMLRKDRHADQKIAELKADARIIERVGDELQKVIEQYGHLPPELLEPLVEATRTEMLKGYKVSPRVEQETRKMADVNKDGKIGTGDGYELARKNAREIGKRVGGIGPKALHEKYGTDNITGFPATPELRAEIQGVDLEALKELPIEKLFEDEQLAQDTPTENTIANEKPTEDEPDF